MKPAEKRINKRLLQYWNNLNKNSDNIPFESSINPEEIQDLWDNCFIINTKTRKYSYLGKDIMSMHNGQSVIGKDIYQSLVCPENSNLPSIINEVLHTKSPIVHESSFQNKYGVTIKYRRCFLPLSGNDNEISYILGGMRWKS